MHLRWRTWRKSGSFQCIAFGFPLHSGVSCSASILLGPFADEEPADRLADWTCSPADAVWEKCDRMYCSIWCACGSRIGRRSRDRENNSFLCPPWRIRRNKSPWAGNIPCPHRRYGGKEWRVAIGTSWGQVFVGSKSFRGWNACS